MTFYEVIEGLYSDDIHKVCAMLNNGEYLYDTTHEEIVLVHTGFCCQVQTGTIFEVLYSVLDKKPYYLKKRKGRVLAPMGFPLIVNTIDHLWYLYKIKDETEWFDKYNVLYKSFHSVFIKDIRSNDLKCNALVLSDKSNTLITSFSICNNEDIIKKYPLCRLDIPFVYYGHSTFLPYNPGYCTDKEENYYSWRDYGNSYEMYNGYNDWSDDIINDVFDGFPEATWNID